MTAAHLEDPSEREHLLYRDSSAIAFAPRGSTLGSEELIRFLGVDLAAGVPLEIGAVSEPFPLLRADASYAARFYQLGGALAIVTDVDEPEGAHRVVEVLGVKGDVRARINMTRVRTRKLATAGGGEDASSEERELLGNVRVWGGEHGAAERALASLGRHLRLVGLEPQPAAAAEPRFEPPAADRWSVELPALDSAVTGALVELLQANGAEGRPRPPRRLSNLEDRARRHDGGVVAYRFETHRAGTGIVHLRRREVEAGTGRPKLARTWNVVGLRGAARLRVRDVAGRATAEFGGSREGVAAIERFLESRFSGRS